MDGSIAANLRDKLFDNPAPPQRSGHFADLRAEMFPVAGTFLDFLNERHFDEQVRLAKDILLRLAYSARVFPPNKLLFNLLEVESRTAGTAAKGPFNGRDHFVHLVNLYLLGLYVFWYHDALHKKIVSQFEDLVLPPDELSKRERKTAVHRTFVTAWRDFVIFHDLGYPWEISDGQTDFSKFLKPFSNALRYAGKDAALYVLSQVLALESLRSEDGPPRFEDDFKSYFTAPRKPDEYLFPIPPPAFINDWKDARRLPLTSDDTLWLLVETFVPLEDQLTVLESSESGHPVASLNPDLHKLIPQKHRVTLDDDFQVTERGEYRRSGDAAAGKERERYHLVRYVRRFNEHVASLTVDLFKGARPGGEDFTLFTDNFLGQLRNPPAVGDGIRFEDYTFMIYQLLLESIDFDLFEDTKTSDFAIYHRLLRGEMQGQQGILLAEITRALRGVIEAKAKALDEAAEPMNPSTHPLAEYLSELFVPLTQTEELVNTVQSALSGKIKTRVALKKNLFAFYSVLKREISDRVDHSLQLMFPLVEDKDLGTFKAEPAWENFAENSLASGLGELLKERGLGGWKALKEYRPDFAPKADADGPPYCDHGLASGLLYAQMHHTWNGVLHGGDAKLQRILGLRGVSELKSRPKREERLVSHEILYSVFVHNLYPKAFRSPEHQAFRTKLAKRQAFSYLALLCDSLQPWDRKRLFNPATGNPPYSTYAENFNLEVIGDMLRISERGDRLQIDERETSLRRYLNDFLDGASHFVRLRLAEWR